MMRNLEVSQVWRALRELERRGASTFLKDLAQALGGWAPASIYARLSHLEGAGLVEHRVWNRSAWGSVPKLEYRGGDCVMFSGGMDSLISALWQDCKRLIYVRLGHQCQFQEERAARWLAGELGADFQVLQGPCLYPFEELSAYIPGRNLVLAYMGALQHDVVWLGLREGGKSITDRSRQFCIGAGVGLSMALGRKVKVSSPVFELSKNEVVAWFLEKGYPYEWLRGAWSCSGDGPRECGECRACFRKWVALTINGVDVRDLFEMSPGSPEIAQGHLKNLDQYDEHRRRIIKEVMDGVK